MTNNFHIQEASNRIELFKNFDQEGVPKGHSKFARKNDKVSYPTIKQNYVRNKSNRNRRYSENIENQPKDTEIHEESFDNYFENGVKICDIPSPTFPNLNQKEKTNVNFPKGKIISKLRRTLECISICKEDLSQLKGDVKDLKTENEVFLSNFDFLSKEYQHLLLKVCQSEKQGESLAPLVSKNFTEEEKKVKSMRKLQQILSIENKILQKLEKNQSEKEKVKKNMKIQQCVSVSFEPLSDKSILSTLSTNTRNLRMNPQMNSRSKSQRREVKGKCKDFSQNLSQIRNRLLNLKLDMESSIDPKHRHDGIQREGKWERRIF